MLVRNTIVQLIESQSKIEENERKKKEKKPGRKPSCILQVSPAFPLSAAFLSLVISTTRSSFLASTFIDADSSCIPRLVSKAGLLQAGGKLTNFSTYALKFSRRVDKFLVPFWIEHTSKPHHNPAASMPSATFEVQYSFSSAFIIVPV
jgi:hypothetical protein